MLQTTTMAIDLFNQLAKALIAFAKDQTTLSIMTIQFVDENENFTFTFEPERFLLHNSRMSYSVEYRAFLQADIDEITADVLKITLHEKNGNEYTFLLTSD